MKSREQHMLDLLEHVDWECFNLAKVEVVIEARDDEVRRAERAAIVRWLRATNKDGNEIAWSSGSELAWHIERGEHLK